MDALSDVLRAVRLKGAIFFDVHASDPWAAETPAGKQIVGRMFPAAGHLISYHAITRGTCWAVVADEPPLLLTAGDVVVSRTVTRMSSRARPGYAALRTSNATARRTNSSSRSRSRWAAGRWSRPGSCADSLAAMPDLTTRS